MNKKLKILFFCMIVVGGGSSAQIPFKQKGNLLLNPQPKFYITSATAGKKPLHYSTIKQQFIPGDFYSKKLGFICRQEIKMDKLFIVPIRFRLGTVEQCNWLEGKKR